MLSSLSVEKRILYFGVPALAIVLGAIFYFLGSVTAPYSPPGTNPANQGQLTTTITPIAGTQAYYNTDFKIALNYPSSWKPVTGHDGFNKTPLYFQGADGFFSIDAVGADLADTVSIDDVVRALISDTAKPYGSSPTVQTLDANFGARLIIPSSDQPAAKNTETSLIVKYPKPLKIGNNTFLFFMLSTDKAHISDIAGSLQITNL